MLMSKFIYISLLILTFSSNSFAKNKLNQIDKLKEVKTLPNSTKLYICEEYTIISSDHCKLIKNFFNSVYKND